MIWFHAYSLLLGKKSKSLAGLIACAVSSLSFYFLCSIIWKYKCLEVSPHLLCHLLLGVRRSVCCSQPLILTSAVPSSIQTGDVFWEGAHWFSSSLKLAIAVAQQRRGSSTLRPLAVADVALLASCMPCLYLSVVFWLVWAVCALGKDCPSLHGTTCSWTLLSSAEKLTVLKSVINCFKNQNIRGYLLLTTYVILCLWTHQFHIFFHSHTQQYGCSQLS